MKTKRGFFCALAVIVFVGLSSCMDGEGGNTKSFEGVPSYVTYSSSGKTMLQTSVGNVYVSGLESSAFDSYGLSSFNIDYDNQPQSTDNTLTASLYGWFKVSQSSMKTKPGEMKDSYHTDSIVNAGIYYSNELLNKNIFLAIEQNAASDRVYDYDLIFNTDSTNTYKMPSVYLMAKITTPGTSSTTYRYFYRAFDVSGLISSSYARDTTIYTKDDYKYVKFNLHYQVGVDSQGNPKFKEASPNNQLILFDYRGTTK